VNSQAASANFLGITATSPFTALASKRSEIISDSTAAKATAALRRKAMVTGNWPSHISRQLSVAHDGGATFYVTWPNALDEEVLDLELTGHAKYPKASRNVIHKFINDDLTKLVTAGYDADIGTTIDQFVVGVF